MCALVLMPWGGYAQSSEQHPENTATNDGGDTDADAYATAEAAESIGTESTEGFTEGFTEELLTGGTFAEESGDLADITSSKPLISTWEFIRMILMLGGVIGVIYGLFYFLKKSASKKIPENDLVSVLGSKTLVGNRALHLIEVGSSIFLIGSSDDNVNLISEISDKESQDRIRLQTSEREQPVRRSFREVLFELFKPQGTGLITDETVHYMKQQKERLQKMR